MKTPWQAKPVPGTRRRRVTGTGEGLRKTAARHNVRGRCVPEAPRGERPHLPQAGLIREVRQPPGPAPGMRKAGQQARPREGMSANARTWSSPTAAQPLGRPSMPV